MPTHPHPHRNPSPSRGEGQGEGAGTVPTLPQPPPLQGGENGHPSPPSGGDRNPSPSNREDVDRNPSPSYREDVDRNPSPSYREDVDRNPSPSRGEGQGEGAAVFIDPISFSRRLRKNATHVETILWHRLKARAFQGHKFRRQHPLGPYIVDFVDLERQLVIELDGGQHATNRSRDAQRDAWLSQNGYRVLRFWDNDVTGNLDGVLETIAGALKQP